MGRSESRRRAGPDQEAEQRFVLSRSVLPGYVASTVGYGPQPTADPPPRDPPPGDQVPRDQVAIHRGLPSPYLTFIFSLAGPVVTGGSVAEAHGPGATRTDVVLGGLARQPSYVVPDPAQRGVQLAVHPLAARALFGLPARDLLDVTDAELVLGADAGRLREQLTGTRGWSARFALVQHFLRDRWSPRPGAGSPGTAGTAR